MIQFDLKILVRICLAVSKCSQKEPQNSKDGSGKAFAEDGYLDSGLGMVSKHKCLM